MKPLVVSKGVIIVHLRVMDGVTIREAASQVTAVLVKKPVAKLVFRLLQLSHHLTAQRTFLPSAGGRDTRAGRQNNSGPSRG